MVTGKLTQTFPRFQLYNSDSRKRTVGIWRYAGGGIIEPAYYDYDTEMLGPYKFKERFGYVVRFYVEKSTPPYHILYRELLATKTAVAAFFVNNSYVCLLYPDALKYMSLEKPEDVHVFKFKEGEFSVRNMMDVGWVKTTLLCQQVTSLPYRLQMDLNTGEMYLGNGLWVPPDGFPAKQTTVDYPMYKRLLENKSAKAVMYDVFSNKEVFL